ncbi:MAG TPA: hypothetical protein VGB48_01815 [Allosphingosinicella sp.]|jgi:hypothetical protein
MTDTDNNSEQAGSEAAEAQAQNTPQTYVDQGDPDTADDTSTSGGLGGTDAGSPGGMGGRSGTGGTGGTGRPPGGISPVQIEQATQGDQSTVGQSESGESQSG